MGKICEKYMVKISPWKLQDAFNKSGCKTYAEMSEEIGRSKTFISKYLRVSDSQLHTMRVSDIELIKLKYGIDVTFTPEDEEREQEQEQHFNRLTTFNAKRGKRVKVDLIKLEQLRAKIGCPQTKLGDYFGRSMSFYYDTVHSGSMIIADYMLILEKYGIDIAWYPEEQVVDEPITERKDLNSDIPKGQEDIYLAVYFGVLDALKEYEHSKNKNLEKKED